MAGFKVRATTIDKIPPSGRYELGYMSSRNAMIHELIERFLASDAQAWELTGFPEHKGKSSPESVYSSSIRQVIKKSFNGGVRVVQRAKRLYLVKEES